MQGADVTAFFRSTGGNTQHATVNPPPPHTHTQFKQQTNSYVNYMSADSEQREQRLITGLSNRVRVWQEGSLKSSEGKIPECLKSPEHTLANSSHVSERGSSFFLLDQSGTRPADLTQAAVFWTFLAARTPSSVKQVAIATVATMLSPPQTTGSC